MKLYYLLLLSLSAPVLADEGPSEFKIKCNNEGQKLTFELSKKYPDYLSENNGANDLQSVRLENKSYYDVLNVSYSTPKSSLVMRGNPNYVEKHLLTYSRQESGKGYITFLSYHTVKLSKNGNEILNVVTHAKSLRGCVSVGIW